MKSSGELALLTATEVRTALARLDAQLLTNQFVENDVATVQAGNIDVYLVDNVDMRVIYGDTLGVTFELSPTAELPDIESDMQLRNRILLKLDIVRFLLDEYRNTRELIQNARNEIAAQLQIDR